MCPEPVSLDGRTGIVLAVCECGSIVKVLFCSGEIDTGVSTVEVVCGSCLAEQTLKKLSCGAESTGAP